ncbi:autoinducer binding domain-containing protein [Aquincola sp. S2]|uniref:Autoinducer binding domain-containing protein n=1 Tax=Pseudaquabacterium terrae TaxID=2732868 RepID=A0ABX2ETB1_9BURK|nr:autoinducer binding domain-containing protein [Aquabacterium terrae]
MGTTKGEQGARLRDEFLAVTAVATPHELLAQTLRFTRQLGFDTVSAMAVLDRFGADSDFVCVHNTPAAFLGQFHDTAQGRRCPVMQHCKLSSLPILWDRQTYAAVDQADVWETQAPFGFAHGIAMALHLPGGRHFFIGVDRDRALPRCPAETSRMTADLQLFAVHAQDTALRLLLPPATDAEPPPLTTRELEGLRWTMHGKTAWELGRILGISEQTAVRHLHNAARKLGCINKHQAVVKALRLGLIH